MKKIGIDAISFYVPPLYVSIKELAQERKISFEKLNIGLGLNKMAIADKNEDSASFAANALLSLIQDNHLDPKSIGRIYLGTESALDAAKPTATYAIEAVEAELEATFGYRCFKNCDVLDMTFACIGGVDALHNSIDWVRSGNNKQAVVITSDIAKYELRSTGEYTQGAGAVALLIKEEPSILSISETWGVSTMSVGDFFKPRRTYNKLDLLKETIGSFKEQISDTDVHTFLKNSSSEFWSDPNENVELFKEEPVYDGPFSNACYHNRITEALDHYKTQKKINVLREWGHLIFHLPYAFQARRLIVNNWINWLKENNKINSLYLEIGNPPTNDKEKLIWIKKVAKSKLYKKFIAARIEPGEKASSEIGNMYTASIFMSLLSLLSTSAKINTELSSNKIGFFSYGSGSKSKVFEGQIQPDWKKKINKIQLFSKLNTRTKINVDLYEKLHTNSLDNSIIKKEKIYLSHVENKENNKGLRVYTSVLNK